MKPFKFLCAVLLCALACVLCACKTPEPDLVLIMDRLEAGREISLTDLVSVTAANEADAKRFKPGSYTVRLDGTDRFVLYSLGKQELHFTVTSKKGEEYPVSKTVTVYDDIAPDFTAKKGTVTTARGTDLSVSDLFTYTDLGTPDLADAEILFTENYDKDLPGTYPVTVTVTDRAGNTAAATVSVTVLKDSVPAELNKAYEEEGIGFKALSVTAAEKLLPENPEGVYLFLPERDDGRIYFAIRMELTNNTGETIDVNAVFKQSLLCDTKTGYRPTLFGNTVSSLETDPALKDGRTDLFCMVFTVDKTFTESGETLYLYLQNFPLTEYCFEVWK